MGRYYTPKRKGLQEILNSSEVGRILDGVAEKGAEHARSLSTSFRNTGEYQDSFTVRKGSVIIRGRRRQTRELANTSGHAAVVEFGNAATKGKGHHVLSRTLDFLRSQ